MEHALMSYLNYFFIAVIIFGHIVIAIGIIDFFVMAYRTLLEHLKDKRIEKYKQRIVGVKRKKKLLAK